MDRTLLGRATDSSDAPTPGYMYIDIAKNASASPIACQEVSTYLTRKLSSKQNANIKYKCLKVIAKTAAAVPRGQFKRAVVQDPSAVSAIRLASNFRGPPDPVRGDELYSRVRDAAKEALDAIYSDTPAVAEQSPYSNPYGAPPHQQSSYGGGGGGGGGGMSSGAPMGGRRMEGIGNPMFSDPRLEPQGGTNNFKEVMREAGEAFVGMMKDPLARNVELNSGGMPRPGGIQGMQGFGSNSYNGQPPPGRSELTNATQGQWTMASNRGPNAVGAPSGYNERDTYYKPRENAFSWANKAGQTSGGVGGSWASAGVGAPAASQPSYSSQGHTMPSVTVNSVPVMPPGNAGTSVQDGSYERNLIMELCPPGGMKAVPPPDKLASFSKSVPNLNPDLVCPVLLDCLEEGHPWIMRAKALCVMEVCIQNGMRADNTNAYAGFFFTCRAEVEPLASHPRAAIKEPARRVLSLLGIQPSVPAPSASAPVAAPPAAAPPAEVPNLLDFDDAGLAPTGAPPPVPKSAPPSAPAGDMFGGMTVKATSPAPAQAPAPPNASLLGDLMGVGESAKPAAPPSQTATITSMFDQLNVKKSEDEEEKKKSEDPPSVSAVTTSGGSAFAFLNEPAAQPEAKPAASAKESFDPLLNLTPNTAKQMMQVSQEQMQAMAYQQMMMQQQMQMQMQMQMAMQQQGMMGRPSMPMGGGAPPIGTSFSFIGSQPAATKDDKSFDFVKDAMKNEKSHK